MCRGGEGEGLPGRIVGADWFGSGSGKPVSEAVAARFLGLRIGPEQQPDTQAEAGKGGRKVDLPVRAGLAVDELDLGGKSHGEASF
jgi:hypothetical protein